MDVSEISNILQDISDFRFDDVPRLIKALDNLAPKLKQSSYVKSFNDQSEEAKLLWVKKAVQIYCNALSSAKLARTFHKVLNALPESYCTITAHEIRKVVQELAESTDICNLRILSALIDQNAVAKAASKHLFSPLSNLLKTVLSTARAEGNVKSFLGEEENAHLSIKLCVQVLQIHPQSVGLVLAAAAGDTASTAKETREEIIGLVDIWRDIILSLLTLLMKDVGKDLVLLTGTALSMAFNLVPNFSICENAFMNVISLLTNEKTAFYFGSHIWFDASESCLDIPQDPSLQLIAIIKGLLVSCQKEKLYIGNPSLLLQVYSHIINLCKGQAVHHYLAFHLLALWYRKLEQAGNYQHSAVTAPSDHGEMERERSTSDSVMISDGCENRNPNKMDKGSQELVFFNFEASGLETHVEAQSSFGYLPRKTSHVDNGEESKPADEKHSNDGHSACEKNPSMLMSSSCAILNSTLSCIWLNWDSPVDGVSEFVTETFSCLLRVWQQCLKTGISDYYDLPQHLMDKLLSMAWHTRARYRPLSLLLPYVDCVKLHQEHAELKADLLRCMKTNHMAAIASDVYKAFLQQLVVGDESEAIRSWTVVWLPTLLQGLTSTDSLQRLKTCTYWLPPTFKVIIGSHSVLLSTLAKRLGSADTEGYYQWLFAWITVSRIVRELLHTNSSNHAGDFLKEGLFCDEEEIRGEAVMFLCSSVKKAEPMTVQESDLLRLFIPANLKTDSAPFRQNMTTAVRRMAMRIRDSCLSAVRNKKTEAFVENSLAFVDWLYKLLMMSLGCGGSYQRRQTTFDLLSALLETLVYQERDTSKKGKAQEESQILLHHAQSQGLWNFFRDEHLLTVLVCLEDGADEIQNQAYNLLLKFFKWPKTICHTTSLSPTAGGGEATPPAPTTEAGPSILARSTAVLHIVNRALSLLSSPRAYENHSGLLMMSLVLNRYVMDLGITFSASQLLAIENLEDVKSNAHSGGSCSSGNSGEESATNAALAFLDLLITKMKVSIDAVHHNLGASFRHHPIHGLTQCITRCLQDITKRQRQNQMHKTPGWGSRLVTIVTLNQGIISRMLEVLAGGKFAGQEDCPSFAEMGVALESLLSGDQKDQEEEMASLSPEFQLLLSWCWLNIRESCSALGEVTSAAMDSDGNCQLSNAVLTSIGRTFVKILTTCRHRGAIEGCRGGLLQFCTTLMTTGNASFADIPKTILQQILDCLSENSLTSSITRRSAGLPIIVQTVVQAAWKCGNTGLLSSTVEQLYFIASQPLPTDHSQQQDLSQSHSLNILKVIFCDASLAPHLMPLLSRMTILVVEGFDSQSWAIRNAATQLISTLVTRIFGQKNKVDNSNSMTLEEFGGQYPELLQFVCDKLDAYKESQNAIKPSLYLILTLLSALGMAPSHQHSLSCRDLLHTAVLSFLSNPVSSLRKLSAQAYIALSPLDAADTTLRQILKRVESMQRKIQMNELHGWLLGVTILMSTGTVSTAASTELLMFLVDSPWLLFGFQTCLLPLSTVFSIIQQALKLSQPDNKLLQKLWQSVNDVIASIKASRACLQVDRDQCVAEGIKTLTSIHQVVHSSSDASLIPSYHNILQVSLSSELDDMRGSVINCLHSDPDLAQDVPIQRTLLENCQTETNISNFIQIVDIFVILALRGKLCIPSEDLLAIDLTSLIKPWRQTHRVQAAVFALEGIIFGVCKGREIEQRWGSLQIWCKLLVSFSDPMANESLRTTAAQSLRITGKNILESCNTSSRNIYGVDDIVCSVIQASLQLLEDTEEDVRHQVAAFISGLQHILLRHYNLCYSLLSQYICEHLSWSEGIHNLLLGMLNSPSHLSNAICTTLNASSQPLFEPETTSAMAEGVISKLWAYHTLQSVRRKTHETAIPALPNAVITACEELENQMPVIEDDLLSKPIFNMSTSPKVMDCMLGLVLLAQLCTRQSLPTTRTQDIYGAERFIHLAIKLKQNSTSHPLLREKYFESSPPLLCNLLPST